MEQVVHEPASEVPMTRSRRFPIGGKLKALGTDWARCIGSQHRSTELAGTLWHRRCFWRCSLASELDAANWLKSPCWTPPRHFRPQGLPSTLRESGTLRKEVLRTVPLLTEHLSAPMPIGLEYRRLTCLIGSIR